MFFKTIILLSIITLLLDNSYAQSAWGAEVVLNIKEQPLHYVLKEIKNQSKLNLIYDVNLTKTKILTCNLKSSAENVITEALHKFGFSFKKFDDNSAVIFEKKSPIKKRKAVVRKSNLDDKFLPSQFEISKPTLLSKIELNYPQQAMKERIEGEVLAKILVTKKGDVSKVELERSSGHKILDTATINYVRKLKFLPAEYNGKYKKVWTTMLVKYNFE